jgi:hypothetical protein
VNPNGNQAHLSNRGGCSSSHCADAGKVRQVSIVGILTPHSKPASFPPASPHAQQLVFAKNNQTFVMRIVGSLHKLHNLRINQDYFAMPVDQGNK